MPSFSAEPIEPAAGATRDSWYRVDNAGKIFSSLHGKRLTTLFRLSCTLHEPVHVNRLQTALENLQPRFPYFMVQLRPGAFWYYFEHNQQKPLVTADSRYPCLNFAYRSRGLFPFRVRVYHGRISVEYAHALTDGTGGIMFLLALVAEYLRLSGIEAEEKPEWLMTAEQTPHPEESEDAFRRYYQSEIPTPPPEENAFHLPFDLEPYGIYHIITGIVPVGDIKSRAKDFGVSITELLIATYLDAFQQVLQTLPARQRQRLKRPIRLDIPVNLRPFFPSRTMRNFFLPVLPAIDPRLGHYEFEDILQKVHHVMGSEIDRKHLLQQMARNVQAERRWTTRAVPLLIKDRVLSLAYDQIAQKRTSSGLSNLGLVTLPPRLEAAVERFDFIPPPPTSRRVNCGVIGFRDSLNITFGRTCGETLVEEAFFRRLTSLGIRVKVESN